MSRVCKKIAGLFGLAFVIGMTAIASGIPPIQQASAVSGDVNIQFQVVDANFMAQIIQPADGSVSYSADGVTAKISYSNAQVVNVYLTHPDGTQVLVTTVNPPTGDPDELDVVLPVSDFGEYILTVTGTDLTGNAVDGDAIAFSYRAVTAEVSEDGEKVTVSYGTDVCKLGFQVYKVTDTAKENPLLDPEYIMDVVQTGNNPNVIDVAIPGFENLGPNEFTVVVTAYNCAGDPLDSYDLNMLGVITPPKTGAINILGITISQTDYLITGLIVFVLAAIFALFLLGRRKKTNR